MILQWVWRLERPHSDAIIRWDWDSETKDITGYGSHGQVVRPTYTCSHAPEWFEQHQDTWRLVDSDLTMDIGL